MKTKVDAAVSASRSPSRGPCFVYIAPCSYEDILKLGFSRDPLQRLQTLHRRCFEFFDLEETILIATETVRDARNMELKLRCEIELHNAPAPLVIRHEAGGETEWYRGAYDHLLKFAESFSEQGYVVLRPARPWLRKQLLSQTDRLFAWSNEVISAMQSNPTAPDLLAAFRLQLLDALDACSAFEIDVQSIVPSAVYAWYRDEARR